MAEHGQRKRDFHFQSSGILVPKSSECKRCVLSSGAQPVLGCGTWIC